jgi:hypothetical protein
MTSEKRKKIIRLLGVGFDAEDDHIRITKSEKYDVIMGSDQSHEYIQQLIQKIEDELKAQNKSLDDYTPEEFLNFVGKLT